MTGFVSLVFAWCFGNIWFLCFLEILGLGVGYFLLTTAYAHRVYWHQWQKHLFHIFSKLPKKNISQNPKSTIRNRKHLIRQIPLFLQTLSNAVKAGYSLEQAFVFIAEEIDPPLQQAIEQLNEKGELHIPIEKALEDFGTLLHHPDIDFFVESTILQIHTGGNLVELFHKVSNLVEERRKLAQDIKSFTSQGKMSGILIAILWPVSLVLFSILAPTHIHTLFFTVPGQCLLVISLLLELIGFACIWKIIRVKI